MKAKETKISKLLDKAVADNAKTVCKLLTMYLEGPYHTGYGYSHITSPVVSYEMTKRFHFTDLEVGQKRNYIVATTESGESFTCSYKTFKKFCRTWSTNYVEKLLTDKETITIEKKVLEDICRYCETQAIYDKLSAYNDFYYKIKKLLK